MSKTVHRRTYAAAIRCAMAEKAVTKKNLAKAINFSYEHVRKICDGFPVLSEQFNASVCKVLGLDVDAMWDLARREKAQRSGYVGGVLPNESRLQTAWPDLSIAEQERVIGLVEALADANRMLRSTEELKDPFAIRDRIVDLLKRMS